VIKPRPPHQAADKFLRLAKLAVTLGMEFEDAAIGVDHELVASIGPALPRLSSALQTLSQDMRRQAMTPPPEPPPAPKPTPILDFLESKEQAEATPAPADIVPEVPKLRPFVVVVDVEPIIPVVRVALSWPDDEAQEDLRALLGDRRGFCRLIEVTAFNADAYRETPWLANMERAEILARVDEAWNNSPKLGDSVRAHAAHPKVPNAHADPEGLTPTWVAYGGRNPLFYLAANSEDVALAMIEAEIPGHGCTVQCQGWDFIESRSVPSFGKWNAAQAEKCREAAAPKAKRPKPAKPEPGEKLGKRQCWVAKVAGKPAFRVYAHALELAEGQLAFKVPRASWPEASIALEFTNRSQDFNTVPMLSDLAPDQVRDRIRLLLAEAEHESGSGFVAPMPEEPPTKVAEADGQAEHQTLVAKYRPTGQRLFTIYSPSEDAARDYIGMTLTADQLDEIDLFSDEDVSALGLPDWEEFDLDTLPADAMSGPAPDITPAYPTESPRDPLASLSIGELDLRKPVLELLASRGIATAGQLFDELDGEMLDGLLSEEQEEHVRKKILRWESERHSRIVADGSWLDEELTYAAFRLGDAPEFWGKMRERGATDAELRDAINKRFFAMGGVDCRHRAGYRFHSGPAPAFYLTSDKPKRGQEPALEGKHLIDAVRRLLAIPTREEPSRPSLAKASKRKAVKA